MRGPPCDASMRPATQRREKATRPLRFDHNVAFSRQYARYPKTDRARTRELQAAPSCPLAPLARGVWFFLAARQCAAPLPPATSNTRRTGQQVPPYTRSVKGGEESPDSKVEAKPAIPPFSTRLDADLGPISNKGESYPNLLTGIAKEGEGACRHVLEVRASSIFFQAG